MKGRIVAGAIGNCVHVAGVYQFLRTAEEMGYETVFLGAAVSEDDFVDAIRTHAPDLVGVSYRLTPEVGRDLLRSFEARIDREGLGSRRFAFGGTPPVCRVAKESGFFERCFDGLESLNAVRTFLGGTEDDDGAAEPCDDLIGRIADSRPLPLLRHHFGLPDLQATIEGVREIAEAGVLDVVSLAPDQNAQESFFRPGEMNPALDGAGGVPIRTKDDLLRLKDASQVGNRPMMRVYSGTRDLVEWAALAEVTIRNAWGAVPLCWYSALDGRSSRPPEDAIRENQSAMRWYAQHGTPLEVNESHHWSLRDAHDAVAVTMAYLAAYNAKAAGCRHYVAQYMFNTPPMTSPAMDLAKMQAKIDLIESLHDDNFTSFRQTRAGLLHLSPKKYVAKGQLAASTAFALMIRPHVLHVVGYCEGDHAALPDDVIESCEIVQGVIRNCRTGQPDFLSDPKIRQRRDELVAEAGMLLESIRFLGEGSTDPLTDPAVLARAIRMGLLDAPHLKGNPHAWGRLETRCVDGAIRAFSREAGRVVAESERIASLRLRERR